MPLRIATVNVRGLANDFKRKKMFNYFHRKELDIIMIQESHSSKNKHKLWKAQYGGRIYFSHGETNARGVAILINKKTNIKIKREYKDDCGRVLILDIEYENISLSLCNIYAPNHDDPEFVNRCSKMLLETGNITKIIGGDFNLVMDLKLDKVGGKPTTHTKTAKTLKKYLDFDRLVDAWRNLHPNERTYTWFKHKPNYMAERLDYIFVTKCIMSNVERCDIIPSFCTDHSMVILTFCITQQKRGRGFWKLNTSLLQDENYIEKMNEVLEDILKTPFEGVQKKWDFLKYKVKSETVKFSKIKKNSEKNKLEAMERKGRRLQDQIDEKVTSDTFNIEQNIEELQYIKGEINLLCEQRTRGAMIRSRVNWYLYGEKSSKFFFKLEKYNSTKKNRYALQKDNGEITYNMQEILKLQYEFYKRLFTEKQIEGTQDFFDTIQIPKLTAEEKLDLEQDITYDEMIKAMKEMDNDKVPGPDGIPIEWYQKFKPKVYKILYEVIKEIGNKGFTVDEGRGIISLIDKPDKNMLQLSGWRPLSLINVDGKIYSKILANRMYRVLPKLIHHDQTAFLKGRNIGSNIMDLIAVIEECEEKQIDGLLIGIDFEKAFDSVHWHSFFEILKQFNFGEKYIRLVHNLFINNTSCTINNGVSSKWFTLSKGLRQGDCFSPPAFLIVIEILGLLIRQNTKIIGIQVGHKNKKHAQFADDLWVCVRARQSCMDALFKLLSDFAENTGLNINYNKTQVLRIGSLKNTNATLYTQGTISWSRRIKILGMWITPNKEEMIQLNYQKLVDKTNNIIQSWKYRDLTLIGKILVLNTLVASQFVYQFANMYTPTNDILKKLDQMVKEYMWGNKTPKIAYETLKQTYERGGLKLFDIRKKNSSLKSKWLKEAIYSPTTWAIKAQTTLPLPVDEIIRCNISKNDVQYFKNESIWYEIWEAWAEVNFQPNVEDDQIIHQIIWCNTKITIQGKPFINKQMQNKGVMRIGDIINPRTQTFLEYKEFCEKFDYEGPFLNYYAIISAIPKEYKQKIGKSKNIYSRENPVINLESTHFSRYMYKLAQEKVSYIDKGRIKWQMELGREILINEWEKIRYNTFKITLITKLRYFQYRMLSSKIVTNVHRAKWDQNISANCTICQEEKETVPHLFWFCKKINQIWKALNKLLNYKLNDTYQITYENVILNNVRGKHKATYNTIILIVKQNIYAKKCLGEEINFMSILTNVQEIKKIEYLAMKRTNQVAKYEKKWKNM